MRNNEIAMPAPGRPCAVSRMWVVSLPMGCASWFAEGICGNAAGLGFSVLRQLGMAKPLAEKCASSASMSADFSAALAMLASKLLRASM